MHSAFCIASAPTGREFDNLTGLHYYRARWYDASVGRFISEDPIGLAGGINQYGYVGSNPQNLTDPSGLIPTTGDLADGLDYYVDRAKRAVSPDYDTVGWYGKFAADYYVGASTDVAKMFYDPLRLGRGLGCAIYGEGYAWWQRGLFVVQDISRAVAIATVVGSVASKVVDLASRIGVASTTKANLPGINRIYSARELIRRSEETGPFDNFPDSFDDAIFGEGSKAITASYFKAAKPGLSDTSILYRLPGTVNGHAGFFEIGVRPSLSGRTEVIVHRFFKPQR